MADFRALFDKAHAAGMAAGRGVTPTPMVVVEHANPLDDASPVRRVYEPVMDGVCGFAWVTVPGTSPFARWARGAKVGHKGYPKGWSFWVREFNQSLTRKEAYARAFAEVLRAAGVDAYSSSRMD